jgi:starch synthase
MNDKTSPSFAFFAQGDAYSTTDKIMGRQSAGEGFIRGLGRTWSQGQLNAVTSGAFARAGLEGTLRDGGFKGSVRWSQPPEFNGARTTGALYFPAPLNPSLARFRNRIGPGAFSLFGVTHTLSTDRTMDGLAAMVMPPFKPWDALICTSKAALSVVEALFEEVREDLRRDAGVERFAKIQLPVIPLGANCDRFAPATDAERAAARAELGLADDEVAVLFAGRLSFHAKANPAPMYQALQAISGEAKIVCVEAGLFPNDGIRNAFRKAQKLLAPNVRFVHAPGDKPAYAAAWKGADVFTSLSDNVQETFGLTPVEAMAAGLPVVVSDWNGYRDNIRHGQDGFLIPTLAAPPGAGEDLGLAVEAESLSYDRQIGVLSLAVAVEMRPLVDAFRALITDQALRKKMGASGRKRALETFDWPVVLRAYDALARQLAMMRAAAASAPAEAWPQRADPFERFAGFSTRRYAPTDQVALIEGWGAKLDLLYQLSVANFAFDDAVLPKDLPRQMAMALVRAKEPVAVQTLLAVVGGAIPVNQRALVWLAKFGAVEITPA